MSVVDVVIPVVILAVLGGAVAFVVHSVRASRAATDRGPVLQPLAARLGFQYFDRAYDESVTASPLYGTLFRALFHDPLRRLETVGRDDAVVIYESTYLGGDRNPHQVAQLCFAFRAKEPRWPRFLLRPQPGAPEPRSIDGQLVGIPNVSLGLADFEAAYTVAAPDPDDARAFFGPRLVSELMRLVPEGQAVTVESLRTLLLVWRPEVTVPAERVEQLLGLARRVRQAFDEAADAFQRQRASAPPPAVPPVKCPLCGATVPTTAKTCPGCGTSTDEYEDEEEEEENE